MKIWRLIIVVAILIVIAYFWLNVSGREILFGYITSVMSHIK